MKRLSQTVLLITIALFLAGCTAEEVDIAQAEKISFTKEKSTGKPLVLDQVLAGNTEALSFADATPVDSLESDQFLTYVGDAKQRDRKEKEAKEAASTAALAPMLSALDDMFSAIFNPITSLFSGGSSDATQTGGDSGQGSDDQQQDQSDDGQQDQSDDGDQDDEARFTSDDFGFSIVFPAGWAVSEADAGDTKTFTADSPKEDAADAYQEKISVGVDELPIDMTSAEYLDGVREKLDDDLIDFDWQEEATATIVGLSGRRAVYTYQEGDLKMKSLLYAVSTGDRGYAITSSALKGDYGDYLARFEAAVESFEFE